MLFTLAITQYITIKLQKLTPLKEAKLTFYPTYQTTLTIIIIIIEDLNIKPHKP